MSKLLITPFATQTMFIGSQLIGIFAFTKQLNKNMTMYMIIQKQMTENKLYLLKMCRLWFSIQSTNDHKVSGVFEHVHIKCATPLMDACIHSSYGNYSMNNQIALPNVAHTVE